jgi:hypothetical protein
MSALIAIPSSLLAYFPLAVGFAYCLLIADFSLGLLLITEEGGSVTLQNFIGFL